MKHKLQLLICCLLLSIGAFSQNIPSYVPTNGLVGYWPFNGNANDESGNANHGTVNGATLTTDRNGIVGKAYSFDGLSNTINLNQEFFGGGQITKFSFYCRVYFNSLTNVPNIWGKTLFWGEVNFLVSNDGTISFFWANSITGNKYSTVSTMPILQNNNWYDLVFVYENSSAKIFVNGNQVQTNLNWIAQGGSLLSTNQIEASCNFTQDFNSSKFGVRINSGAPTGFLNGKLDDIAIYNRALTQQEITALYTGVPPCTPTSSTTNLTIPSTSLPYTWNGLTFNNSGAQTATLSNAGGCDSAATLNLTVNTIHNSLIYVSNNGNDSGSYGAYNSPFKTINQALIYAQPNDTIILKSGFYQETFTITKNICISSEYIISGDSNIRNSTVLDGSFMSPNSSLITTSSNGGLKLLGLTIQNCVGSVISDQSYSPSFISKMKFINNGNPGITTINVNVNSKIEYSEFYFNRGNPLVYLGQVNASSINLPTLNACVFEHNGDANFMSNSLVSFWNRAIATNNLFFNNNGVMFSGGCNAPLDTIIIEHNTVVGNNGYGIFIDHCGGGIQGFFRNNIIENNTKGCLSFVSNAGGYSVIKLSNNKLDSVPYYSNHPFLFNISWMNNDTTSGLTFNYPITDISKLALKNSSTLIGKAVTPICQTSKLDFYGRSRPDPIGSFSDIGAIENSLGNPNNSLISYNINSQSNSNGTTNPSGNINVNYGSNQRITITPNAGYYADSVLVDDIPVDSITGYTFSNITANHTLRVVFKMKYNNPNYITNSSAATNSSNLFIAYQAYARNNTGVSLTNKSIQVKFSLLTDSINGSVVCAESHSLSTNSMGLFTAEIGNGTPIQGTWQGINWSASKKYLKTEIDMGSGWLNMGTQQLLAVPYAIHSNTSNKIENANLPVFNTNAAATNAGLLPGQLYRTTSGVLQIVY